MAGRRVMTFEKLFQLEKYLRESKDQIAIKKLTTNDTAIQASQDLGFPISMNNIRGVSEVLGIKFPKGNYSHGRKALSKADFLIVVDAVVRLYNKLGEVDKNLTILRDQLNCSQTKEG